jgi:hypothetical protein
LHATNTSETVYSKRLFRTSCFGQGIHFGKIDVVVVVVDVVDVRRNLFGWAGDLEVVRTYRGG